MPAAACRLKIDRRTSSTVGETRVASESINLGQG
jgi:hypothetical protein